MTDREEWIEFLDKYLKGEKEYFISDDEIEINPENNYDYGKGEFTTQQGKIKGDSWTSLSINFTKEGKFLNVVLMGD